MTLRVWIELTLLALIWGGSFLAIRIALDEISVLAAVSHRVFWAALLLWGVVFVTGHKIPKSLRIWGAFLVMGLLNNVIPFGLMAWGQLHIETGLTAILNAATAIWGVLVAALVFSDERLTARRMAGVLIGFFGVALAVGLDSFRALDLRSLAQLAVIGGTISYAFAGSWARAMLRDQAPIVAAAGMLSGSCLIIVPATVLVEGQIPLALEPQSYGAILYFSIAATALAYVLYYRVLAVAGAGNVLLVTLMIPPIAILLGGWVRDESLGANAFWGFGVLALGLLLLDGRIGKWLAKHREGP